MTGSRADRVADRIRDHLARLLREEIRDPRIGFVTLTGVDLSPDLRHARVFVSLLDQDPQPVLRALHHATPFLRRGLARTAGLRFTPALRFEVDPSVEAGDRVDTILRRIHSDSSSTEDDDESTTDPEQIP